MNGALRSFFALLLAALLVGACGSGDTSCNEACEDSSDCIEDHSCVAVGDSSNMVCMPEPCEDCGGRGCVVTAPVDGACSFGECM